jgi:general secretion pathway protein L
VTETLFIRLGSQAHDIIYWLVVAESSSDEQEIIASGELKGAEQLSELTEKSERRQVKVLVPGSDVLLKSLKVPAKSSKAIRLAVPYMLEDIFAEDVEKLFFSYADLPNDAEDNNCFTAIVAHQQMQQWLSWLEDAKLYTDVIVPDVLAMPFTPDRWSAITLGDTNQEQVIVRQGFWKGFTLDTNVWQLQWQHLSTEKSENAEDKEQLNSINVDAYSYLAQNNQLTIKSMPEELPLALMAKNYHSKLNHFNLLQGQYKVKKNGSNTGQQWLWVAGVALFALLLNLGHKGSQLWQLNAEQEKVQQSIIASYKNAFPQTKRVRISTIKSQLNRELALLGGTGDKEGFLAMLAKLQPAFAKVPGLKPETLKFDGKRQELRLQATAKNYQAFEKFSAELAAADLIVKQGAQNNQGDQVTGSFSITNKGMRKDPKKSSTKRSGKNKEAS